MVGHPLVRHDLQLQGLPRAGRVAAAPAAQHRPGARRLLDVACRTGEHLRHLQAHFAVEGIDASPDMLAIAQAKLPDGPLHLADMRSFDLGRTFDAAVCMFSAVGHLSDEAELGAAMQHIARHLDPGGVLLLEPWRTPEAYVPGTVHGLFIGEIIFEIRSRRWQQRENVIPRMGREKRGGISRTTGRASGRVSNNAAESRSKTTFRRCSRPNSRSTIGWGRTKGGTTSAWRRPTLRRTIRSSSDER